MDRDVADRCTDDFRHRGSVVDKISLVQNHYRRSTAFDRDQQIPFDPSWIEVAVEAGDEKHGIDISRDHLLLRWIPGRAA